MLVIRFVRTGKKHQAYFRIAVADSKKSPTAKFVEILGNYDPHAKKLTIEKDRLALYLKNGAVPSNSVAKLLKNEKIAMPKWVKITEKKKASKQKIEVKEASTKTEEVKAEAASEETPAEASTETPAEEVKEETVEEPAGEAGENPAEASAEAPSEDNAEK